MTSKDRIRLGAAAALLVVAFALFALLWPKLGHIPDLEETKTLWYCTACKSGFELTGQQRADLVAQRRVEDGKAMEADRVRARRPEQTVMDVAKCPFCGSWSGVRARRCPQCGEVFAAKTSKGAQAVCPHCGWNPAAAGQPDH
jgi:DNA-directed RNA polymerase subunit RPC12/RpoP